MGVGVLAATLIANSCNKRDKTYSSNDFISKLDSDVSTNLTNPEIDEFLK